MAGSSQPATASPSAQLVTLATVMRMHVAAWLQKYRVPPRYLKVLQAIATCQTAAQGGRKQWCRCGFERYVFFSCRNRHCPQCQTKAKEDWYQARRSELLPVPYFHHVFTLPHELNRLIWWSERNQRALLKALFDAAAETLLLFGRRELGGQVGFTMLLHTWDQQLRAHPHVHCLMPSGALADAATRWVAGGARFLFSVRALSKVYQAKYLDRLALLWEQAQLDLPPELQPLTATQRQRWLRKLRKHAWVVYSKPPFASPAKLLGYLSRYTHRVAISNERILACSEEHVVFSYRDRSDGDRKKQRRLRWDVFIGRFLNHVLPDRFVRIRHYGFLSTRNRRQALAKIRKLIGAQEPVILEALDLTTWLQEILGIDPANCPCCGEPLREVAIPAYYVPLRLAENLSRSTRAPP